MEEIDKSRLDRDFRRKMKELIDTTEKEILVITGEARAFEYFQDLIGSSESYKQGS